jgi:hypothetical protein
MRDRIWIQLANTKFQALYSLECSKIAGRYGRLYSFGLAFVSCGSVAGWGIWTRYPEVWAIIIIVGQLLHLAKPLFPFSKQERDFLEVSFDLEHLYLDYERLWYALEGRSINETAADQRYYKCRDRALHIQKKMKTSHCPERPSRMTKIDAKTRAYLDTHFT